VDLKHPFILRKQENRSYPQVTVKCSVKSSEFMELQKKWMREIF